MRAMDGLGRGPALDGLGWFVGSAPFTPASMTGIQGWWDPTQQIYTDSGSTLCSSDGDRIAQWNDLSGNGRNGTQTTSSSKPTYKTNILNSLPMVTEQSPFTSYLQMASQVIVAEGSPFTIYIVGKRNTSVQWSPFGAVSDGSNRVLIYSDNVFYYSGYAGGNFTTSWTGTNTGFLMRVRMKANKHVFMKATGFAEVDLGDTTGVSGCKFDALVSDEHHGIRMDPAAYMGDLVMTNTDAPTDYASEDTAVVDYLTNKWSVTF